VAYDETVEKVAQALPFLLELLTSPHVRERDQLLQILGEVAYSCCVWRHPTLYDALLDSSRGGVRPLIATRNCCLTSAAMSLVCAGGASAPGS
jgi:hypothetical protein